VHKVVLSSDIDMLEANEVSDKRKKSSYAVHQH
jgi:hypothetical protein